MTGVLGRLRSWVGSLFGGSESDESVGERDATDASSTGGGPVVHRDDRPLETPSGMAKADLSPETVSARSGEGKTSGEEAAPSARAEATDADGVDVGADEAVLIPDAEGGVAEPSDGSDREPTDSAVAADPPTDSVQGEDPRAVTDSAQSDDPRAVTDSAQSDDPRAVTDSTPSDDAPAFKCSVCGTGVDDADATCPLCRSTEVVPAGELGTDAEAMGRGRTETTAADDDAVDALGDLRRSGDE